MKKYEFTGETKEFCGTTLHRIRAVRAFGDVYAGEIGGWIEKEENLSHDGNAWVSGNAWVYGDARVYGDAQVFGNAWVYDDARVYGNALVYGDAWVSGNARVYGNAQVYGNALVYGDADVRKQSHWLCIGPIGSRNGFTTFYHTCKGAIKVVCGCFRGTIDEFAVKIAERHGDRKYAKQYTAAIDVAKACIDLVEE